MSLRIAVLRASTLSTLRSSIQRRIASGEGSPWRRSSPRHSAIIGRVDAGFTPASRRNRKKARLFPSDVGEVGAAELLVRGIVEPRLHLRLGPGLQRRGEDDFLIVRPDGL